MQLLLYFDVPAGRFLAGNRAVSCPFLKNGNSPAF